MALRPVYYIRGGQVCERSVEFEWFAGFAISQKQKSVNSLHNAIRAFVPDAHPLEISTKSTEPLGVKLSAFNLTLDGRPLECVFQSSKVFDDGTGNPHIEWLSLHPKEAKTAADALHSAGLKLAAFEYNGIRFPLLPKTAFYDYIYLNAVRESLTADEISRLADFDHFTDIEFNPKKSLNTQARTAALLKQMLSEFGELPQFTPDDYIEYHKKHIPAI
ncbi:MAG: hypothetical protein IKH78_00360 [Ruminococcus sp.]|nr:hypothetical protein [Ruminococcus sp.]